MNSRIARQPIDIPAGVEVKIDASQVRVKGQKGELIRQLHSLTAVEQIDNTLHVKVVKVCREANAQAGTSRALLYNMVQGVSVGFERKLELVGVGYRAQVQGKALKLSLGFSHPVEHKIPEGITIETPSQTEILIKGIDKQVVGQIAADIRAYRPPEPYKGKGVRYAGEHVVMKETKKK